MLVSWEEVVSDKSSEFSGHTVVFVLFFQIQLVLATVVLKLDLQVYFRYCQNRRLSFTSVCIHNIRNMGYLSGLRLKKSKVK